METVVLTVSPEAFSAGSVVALFTVWAAYAGVEVLRLGVDFVRAKFVPWNLK